MNVMIKFLVAFWGSLILVGYASLSYAGIYFFTGGTMRFGAIEFCAPSEMHERYLLLFLISFVVFLACFGVDWIVRKIKMRREK